MNAYTKAGFERGELFKITHSFQVLRTSIKHLSVIRCAIVPSIVVLHILQYLYFKYYSIEVIL